MFWYVAVPDRLHTPPVSMILPNFIHYLILSYFLSRICIFIEVCESVTILAKDSFPAVLQKASLLQMSSRREVKGPPR